MKRIISKLSKRYLPYYLKIFINDKLLKGESYYFLYYAKLLCLKKEGFLEQKNNIKNLVLGGSTARYDVYAPLLKEHTYNMALDNVGFYENYFILKNFIKEAPNLKNLYLGFMFWYFALNLIKTNQAWRTILFEKYLDIPYNYTQNPNIDFKSINKKIEQSEAFFKDKFVLSNGYDYEISTTFMDEANLAKSKGLASTFYKQYKRGNAQLEYFEKIIELCRENNINITILTFPCFPTIKAELSRIFEGKDENAFIKEYCATHNIKLIDIVDGFNEDDFKDNMHLNINGAIKYTKKLIEIEENN